MLQGQKSTKKRKVWINVSLLGFYRSGLNDSCLETAHVFWHWDKVWCWDILSMDRKLMCSILDLQENMHPCIAHNKFLKNVDLPLQLSWAVVRKRTFWVTCESFCPAEGIFWMKFGRWKQISSWSSERKRGQDSVHRPIQSEGPVRFLVYKNHLQLTITYIKIPVMSF